MKQCHNFTTKFFYYNLPTGDCLHHHDSSYDDHCPTCHAPDKMDDHILQCNSLTTQCTWHSDLIQSLVNPLELLSTQSLWTSLVNASSTSFPMRASTPTHTSYATSVSSSNNKLLAGITYSMTNSLKNGITSSSSTVPAITTP
jgi:hypothetical protein